MTFMNRQHSLSMVSIVNIHGRRIVQLVNTLDDFYQAVVLDNQRNNTREKIQYFSRVFETANQLLTRHSPLAPLGQVDEWQSPHHSQSKKFVGIFTDYGG